jgi:two-component system sensor histidine kinase MtrB
VRWWFTSLPLRVVASTFGASVLVLVLGGWLLMTQATRGVLETKQTASVAESAAAFDSAQAKLYAAGLTRSNLNTKLSQLSVDTANRGIATNQYYVVVQGESGAYSSGGIDTATIPAALRTTVLQNDNVWVTPTEIRFLNGSTEAGLVVGTSLIAPGLGRYPMYLVFPLDAEVKVLEVLQNAVITSGALLLVLLTLIAALVARQVVSPVRAARRAAERLAAGLLDDRMKVKGSDDLARLAISMNHMASELQKQIFQLEELSRVQQRFVSDVSHELRTPLTTVRMASELLYEAREDFDPLAARSAELLHAELDRFESLLTDLLEISRFDAGAAVLTPELTDLVTLAKDVIDASTPLAERYRTTLRLHSEGPCLAEVDPRRVERIVRNLVSNAIEHGEGQPIDVTVAVDDQSVALTVRDHGVGFEAAQAKQVFHRFWRGDPSRSRTVGGNGLGLAISMEDARLHGGWLNAWGRPGRGAQFRLTVPRDTGGILQTSPLPVVPRDLVLDAVRTAGEELAQPLRVDHGVLGVDGGESGAADGAADPTSGADTLAAATSQPEDRS